MSPEDEALAREHRREETVTDDLRGDLRGEFDGPHSYRVLAEELTERTRAVHGKDLTSAFWRFVVPSSPDECWEWSGPVMTTRGGYGRLEPMVNGKRLSFAAHRMSWEIHFGPIPDGMLVCHRCDNPPCVNPAHLFLGTPKDNTRDMVGKGRQIPSRLPGEKNGRARLLWDEVREIRECYRAGDTQRGLAARYGVEKTTIANIVNNRTWIDSGYSPPQSGKRRAAGATGDHDSPWSYGPWDLPPSHAEIASQDS